MAKPAPFARLCIDLGDANDNGTADLSATLKVGPLSLTSPVIDLGFLDAIGFLRNTFEGLTPQSFGVGTKTATVRAR